MAVAEDRSWEYTLGRIDERTEQHGKDIAELRSDVIGLRGDTNDLKDTVSRIEERTEQHGKDIAKLRSDVTGLRGDVNDLGDTVGRLDERTERHGKEISGLRTDVNAMKEAMLTKTTFFAVAAVITALLATMIAMK